MSLGSPFLLKIVSENEFSGKTYFYTIASRAGRRHRRLRLDAAAAAGPHARVPDDTEPVRGVRMLAAGKMERFRRFQSGFFGALKCFIRVRITVQNGQSFLIVVGIL